MQTDFGEITKTEIKANEDGDLAHFLQANITESRDARLIELIRPSGDDSQPEAGTLLIFDIGGRRLGFLINDGLDPQALPGEKEIYSSKAGAKAAKINLRTDGNIELNGDADSAVKFTPLQAAMNALATFINTELGLISTEINNLGGSYTPPTLEIDLSAAEVAVVKLP